MAKKRHESLIYIVLHSLPSTMWMSTEIQRPPVKLVLILAMLAVLGYITLLPATYLLPGYGALILFSVIGFLMF